jgi:hypothetical protein
MKYVVADPDVFDTSTEAQINRVVLPIVVMLSDSPSRATKVADVVEVSTVTSTNFVCRKFAPVPSPDGTADIPLMT